MCSGSSISYLTQTVQITRTQALTGVMAAALVMCVFIPFFGRLSDRIGRTRVYFWGSLITAAASFPGFWLMLNSQGSVMLVWLAIIVPFGIFYAAVYGPEAALFCELFDAKVRYTGISFVYQFSGIFASGITPIIATALLKSGGGQPWLICLYVLFAGLVSALCAWLIGRGGVRRGDRPAVERIVGIVVAVGGSVTRRDPIVHQRLVLGRDAQVQRGVVVLHLRQRARAGDHRTDQRIGQHPGGGEGAGLHAARGGMLDQPLRDPQRFLAELGGQDAAVATTGARVRPGAWPGRYLPVSTPRAIGLYGTTPRPVAAGGRISTSGPRLSML